MRLALLAGLAACLLSLPARADRLHVFTPRLRVYASSSLSGTIEELIAASGIDPDDVATPVFGPSGTLRQRIEAGETAGLFVSADLDGPTRLAARPGALPAVAFAGNRMCVLAPRRLGLTAAALLDRLLDPKLRLATPSPGVASAGDDAFAMFARAESLHPGAAATLSAKAQRLPGPPDAGAAAPSGEAHSPAASAFLHGKTDLLIDFCSVGATVLREVPELTSTPLPAELAVHPVYGLVVLHPTRLATRLALFILSAKGQAILADAGLLPLAPAAPK